MLQMVSYGQVNLRLEVTQQYVGNFYIGDVDFLQQNSGREIFKLHVDEVSSSSFGRFEFDISFVSTDGTVKDLVHFYTNNFTIQPVTDEPYDVISNSDMSSPVEVNYAEERIVIEHTDLNLNNVAEIEDYVQKTGKLPAGKYEFKVLFTGTSDRDVGNFMIIYNPTVIHLSSPGIRVIGAGSELPGMSAVSSTPFFQWHSDARLFNLYVYEKLPTDRTVNDVFGHEPFAEIMDIEDQYYQYPLEPTPIPNGVVRALQEGINYFWYVEAKIPTVTPEEYDILKSEVFQFNVTALDGVQNENQRIIEALKNILIPGYKGQLDQFRGLNPTGAIYINGRKVTVEELEKISFEVLQRNYKIKKVVVD